MAFAMHEVGPPLTEARLAEVERKLRLRLPENYRSFLFQFNGGRPEPEFFPVNGLDPPFDGIQEFMGVDLEIESSSIDWNYCTLKGRIPNELFPIACTGSGDVVCLSLVGTHAV